MVEEDRGRDFVFRPDSWQLTASHAVGPGRAPLFARPVLLAQRYNQQTNARHEQQDHGDSNIFFYRVHKATFGVQVPGRARATALY